MAEIGVCKVMLEFWNEVSVLQTPKISIFEFPTAVNAASRIAPPHAGSDHKRVANYHRLRIFYALPASLKPLTNCGLRAFKLFSYFM